MWVRVGLQVLQGINSGGYGERFCGARLLSWGVAVDSKDGGSNPLPLCQGIPCKTTPFETAACISRETAFLCHWRRWASFGENRPNDALYLRCSLLCWKLQS